MGSLECVFSYKLISKSNLKERPRAIGVNPSEVGELDNPFYVDVSQEHSMTSDLAKDGAALFAAHPTSRRRFMKVATLGSLGTGFASAALPVLSQAIKTDFAGIQSEEVTIDANGTNVAAYTSRPSQASGKLPIVIVASEIFGVHEYIADVTRRLAKVGYLAIAPEFFTRAGEPTELGTVAEIMSQIVAKTPDQQVLGDIEAALKWAGANNGDLSRVGMTGFCWGGRITWLYAAHQPKVKAGVAWYGRLLGQTSALTPQHPIDLTATLHAPVLGLYGSADSGIPVNNIDTMKVALGQGSPSARASAFQVYADAPHAFHADYRPSYREAAAKDGWSRLLAWFKQHGLA
jgi:carboxymethylenebutenolidase